MEVWRTADDNLLPSRSISRRLYDLPCPHLQGATQGKHEARAKHIVELKEGLSLYFPGLGLTPSMGTIQFASKLLEYNIDEGYFVEVRGAPDLDEFQGLEKIKQLEWWYGLIVGRQEAQTPAVHVPAGVVASAP